MSRADFFKDNFKVVDIMLEAFEKQEAVEAFRAILKDDVFEKMTSDE